MCRWLAYSGSLILLEELLYKPDHSLIDQSLHARMGVETTNGDGFGVGWYGASIDTPAVFHSVEPRGRFYLYRAFQDDMLDGSGYPEPLTTLDFGIVVLRTAEAIAVPMAFARAMGAPPEGTTLHYALRWSGLKNRELSSWANPARDIRAGYLSRQPEEAAMISLPLETPTSALGRHVRAATAPLFSAFNGFAPGAGVVEDLTNKVLLRRS